MQKYTELHVMIMQMSYIAIHTDYTDGNYKHSWVYK